MTDQHDLEPPAGNPPLGDPLLGKPPAGNPPLGDPPAGKPPLGDPPSYTPRPQPRTDWARATWGREGGDERATPERWFEPPRPEPAGPAAPPVPPLQPIRPRSRWSGPGTIFASALLAAVLSSGGTYLALDASGALDRVAPAATPQGQMVSHDPNAGASIQPISLVESSAIIDAAAGTGPAVVRITATGTSVDFSGGTIPSTGIGSGVIYDAGGWILTNKHVVTGSNGQLVESLNVELKDGRTFDGVIYGVDTLTDLAIVRIQAAGLPVAPIGTSANLKVGQLAIAIGSPLGTFSNTVTSGIVSATGRSITVENERLSNLIQTDAAINPGNSGGPLLDAGGNVIGINTAIASEGNGIGFAIPIDIARPIMRQALAGEELSRPYLGIRYLSIDLQVQAERDLPVSRGALVGGAVGGQASVVAGGPAAEAGIREGDILVSINGEQIDGEHPLDLVLSGFSPGQTVQVGLLRDGSELTLDVTLGVRPAGL